MTPNQVKTFAAAIEISQTSEVNTRLEEFDALVGNWLVENGNSISVCVRSSTSNRPQTHIG